MLRTADFHSLAFSPVDARIVYFGHHNGAMQSEDGGRTWRQLVDRRNFDAMALSVASANPQQIYLAGHNVFQVSADEGRSWQPVQHDLPGTDIHGFATSLDDPNRLFAFVVGHGLLTSNDGGATWRRLTGGLPADIMSLAAAGGTPETLYAGSMNSGLLKSTDGGEKWSRVAVGPGSRSVTALAVDPSNPRTVFAADDTGLYNTTDGGATWRKLVFPGDNAVALAVAPSQPGVVLAITVRGDQNGRTGLVYRSEDGGQTWGGSQ
ncbi:MAG: hypothetical protein HYY01_12945 [Chloroflexi bacterium]|nr:hypothetical protein [Chloroflexota bacterium]